MKKDEIYIVVKRKIQKILKERAFLQKMCLNKFIDAILRNYLFGEEIIFRSSDEQKIRKKRAETQKKYREKNHDILKTKRDEKRKKERMKKKNNA